MNTTVTPYPIVYIRGFAFNSSEVELTFNSPYNGFNDGSTQYRFEPGSGLPANEHDARLNPGDPGIRKGQPTQRFFESPVIRLIKEEGYIDSFNLLVDDRNVPLPDAFNPKHQADYVKILGKPLDWQKTLWVFRLYDPESDLYHNKARPAMIEYADGLATFLRQIQQAVVASGVKLEDFKVNLVAHSMGGLVARTYLQAPALHAARTVSVNRLFTYATPHGGIEFRNGMEWLIGFFRDLGFNGTDVFSPDNIKGYLGLKSTDPANSYAPGEVMSANDRPAASMPQADDIFCLVGTDAADYAVAYTMSRRVVGPQSDGLVQIQNATLIGAHRAYIAKSHSGIFGIVNSAEGYFHLSRFLFGNLQIGLSIPVGALILHRDEDDDGSWTPRSLDIDLAVAVRNISDMYVNLQRAEDNSAISSTRFISANGGFANAEEIHLTKVFLNHRFSSDGFVRFGIDLILKPTWQYSAKSFIPKSPYGGRDRYHGENALRSRLYIGYDASTKSTEWQWETDDQPTAVPAGPIQVPLVGEANRFVTGTILVTVTER